MLLLHLLALLQGQNDVVTALRVEYILLDVVARNESGQLVTDLDQADFEVSENRKPVALDHFETIDFGSAVEREQPAGGDAAAPAEELDPIEQTLILVLDLGVMETSAIQETFLELEHFLTGLERKNLQIFIFSLDRGFVSRRFVQDPQIALEDLTLFEGGFVSDLGDNRNAAKTQSLVSLEEDLDRCFVGRGADSRIDAANPGAITAGASMVTPCIENAFKIFTGFQGTRIGAVLGTLENVILFLRSVPGLKSIYLLSPGFAYAPGQTAAMMAKTYQDKAGSPSSPYSAPGMVAPGNSGDGQLGVFTSSHFKLQEVSGFKATAFEDFYRRIGHLAMANRIVLHTFSLSKDQLSDRPKAGLAFKGPQGINADRLYFSYGQELEQGLVWLAEASGGSYHHGEQLRAALEQTLDEHRFYYVLGYPKPNTGKKYRNIKITCKRPGISLSHPQGYFPKPAKPDGK